MIILIHGVGIPDDEHVCTTYIHLDIVMFMVQTCTYTFVIS